MSDFLKAIDAYTHAQQANTAEAYEVAADALEVAGELETAKITRLIAQTIRGTEKARARIAELDDRRSTGPEGKL